MAADIIQIVDSVAAAPTVLYDLNNENPCGVSEFQAPPPQLLRASVQTQMRDGATDASTVYTDRVLELQLEVFSATQDALAASLQILARLLSDPRGQWLRYRPNGASKAVFFRIKQADVTSITDISAATALRYPRLSIPAEPFAYGEPVTGSVTITNNPVTGSNPNVCTFNAVQGDVPTPLMLDLKSTAGFSIGGGSTNHLMVASCAMPTGSGFATIPLTQVFTIASVVPAGWTVTDPVADATWAVGGQACQIARASGVTVFTGARRWSIASVPIGEYRLLALIRSTNGSDVYVTAGIDTAWGADQLVSRQVLRGSALVAYRWVDFGVVRAPNFAPFAPSKLSPTPTLGAAVLSGTFDVEIPNVDDIAIDLVALVPVDTDNAIDNRYGVQEFYFGSNSYVRFDPFSDSVYNIASGASAIVQGQRNMVGDFPYLVPGADNTVFVLAGVDGIDDSAGQRSPAVTHDFDYRYYPRYLHVRPATT